MIQNRTYKDLSNTILLFILIYMPLFNFKILNKFYFFPTLIFLFIFLFNFRAFIQINIRIIYFIILLSILPIIYSGIIHVLLPPRVYPSFGSLVFIKTLINLFYGFAFALIFSFYLLKYGIDDVYNWIINIGILQSVFTIIMILFPNVKDFIFHQILYYNINDPIFLPHVYIFRIFGIGSGHLFSLSMAQGLISCISILMYLRVKKSIYLVFVPFLILPVVVNARIGLVPIFFYMLLLVTKGLFYLKREEISTVVKIIIIFSILFIAVYYINISIKLIDFDKYIFWFSREFDSNQINNISVLRSHSFFPQNAIHFMFGEGRYIFALDRFIHSDIGYIIDLHFGGITYILLSYSGLIALNIVAIKYSSRNHENILFISILISTFVVNIKGQIFNYNNYTFLVYMIYYNYLLRINKTLKS